MSYKISYSFDRFSRTGQNQYLRVRILVSCTLLILTALAQFWERGDRLAERLLYDLPVTVTERAVYAFSDALVRGDGWYQGLTIWCRTIIDAGTN